MNVFPYCSPGRVLAFTLFCGFFAVVLVLADLSNCEAKASPALFIALWIMHCLAWLHLMIVLGEKFEGAYTRRTAQQNGVVPKQMMGQGTDRDRSSVLFIFRLALCEQEFLLVVLDTAFFYTTKH